VVPGTAVTAQTDLWGAAGSSTPSEACVRCCRTGRRLHPRLGPTGVGLRAAVPPACTTTPTLSPAASTVPPLPTPTPAAHKTTAHLS